MEENNISPELNSFIEKERWKYPFKLTSNTEVEKDLKVTGDDAIEFLVSFGKEFNVDISQFSATEYFDSDGIDFIGWIVDLFRKKPRVKKRLTLGDLETAIQTKQLL